MKRTKEEEEQAGGKKWGKGPCLEDQLPVLNTKTPFGGGGENKAISEREPVPFSGFSGRVDVAT